MKKRIIAAAVLLSICLSVPSQASVIPQDYSSNNGGMNQWESDLYFFKLNYPNQMELYRKKITEAEGKFAEASAESDSLEAQLKSTVPIPDQQRLSAEKEKADKEAELSKRAILLYMAEIEKTDQDKVLLENRVNSEFLPAPVFEAGQYQAEADYLLREEYIKPTDAVETSPFGWRIHPVTGVRKLHEGIDLANWQGTPILAAKSGIVVFAGYNDISGNNIRIRHYDGQETAYFHMYKTIAKQGDFVTQGEQVGEMGTTGRSTGSHLHFEIRINGTAVDPAPYIYRGSWQERR